MEEINPFTIGEELKNKNNSKLKSYSAAELKEMENREFLDYKMKEDPTLRYSVINNTLSQDVFTHGKYLQQDFQQNINQRLRDFYTLSTTDLGESKYDKNFDFSVGISPTEKDIQYHRAEEQSGFAKLMQGAARMVTTTGTTVVDNVIGSAYGLIEASIKGIANGEFGNIYIYRDASGKHYTSDNYFLDTAGNIRERYSNKIVSTGGQIIDKYNQFLSNFVNNSVSKALNDFNNYMREAMPTYLTEEYEKNREEGRWWKNMGSGAFYGDFLENSGFMIGTAISASMGGAALSKMMGTAALRKVVNVTAKEALEQNLKSVGKEVLSNIPENLAKNANKLKVHNIANTITLSTLSTMAEARMEAINAGDLIAQKATLVEQNLRELKNNLENEVATEHPEWFYFLENPETGEGERIPNEQAL